MATPSATGSVALIAETLGNLNGSQLFEIFTMKAIIINTADEAG